MKRYILSKAVHRFLPLLTSLLMVSGAYADRSEIRFCTDSIHGIGDNKPAVWYGTALRIDGQVVKNFGNCTVDSLRLAIAPDLSAERMKVFITRDLSSVPEWEKDVEAVAGWRSIAVDDGFRIDDRPFYIGYRLYCTSMFDQPMGFDMSAGSAYGSSGYYSVASTEDLLSLNWQTPPSVLGNPTLGCSVSGDIPAVYLCPAGVSFEEYQKPGEPFQVSLPLNNLGADKVEKLTVEVTAGNAAPQTISIEPVTPVLPSAFSTLRFDICLNEDAVEESVRFTIKSVNGMDNPAGNPVVTGPVTCSNDLYPRAFVVEDYTGSRCGYCPIGYVAMDRLTEEFKNSETRFIPIAVHNYSVSPIHCDYYDDYVAFYQIATAPSSMVDREKSIFPTFNNLLGGWNSMAQLSVGRVELKAWFPDEKKTEVKVTATSQFIRDYDNADYGLTFVLTEDNVGPYSQTNYYNDDPSVPEFYQKGEHVMMMYNHVARYVQGWDGIEGSVPETIVKGLTYPYNAEIPLEECNNPDATRLICLLIRKSDGVVINADYIDLVNTEVNGVDDVTDVSPEIERIEYYTITGIRIQAPVKGSVCLERRIFKDGRCKVVKTFP